MPDRKLSLIKAFEGWNKALQPYENLPEGMFGRRCIIKTWQVTIDSGELDFEFEIPFDDDLEANECEIKVYNLSKQTVAALNWNDNIVINAGYKDDLGQIFSGYICSVKTKWEGADFVTTIKAIDCEDLREKDMVETTYAAGTSASKILKDLINKVPLPLGVFSMRRDYTFSDEQKVSGGIMSNIKKFSDICGVSTYINQGVIYSRYIYEGDNTNFIVSAGTGMIESPEEFTEQVSTETGTEDVRGYKLKMLLQHRLKTASIIKLQSENVDASYQDGLYRVRKGKHIWNEADCVTEVEVV